MARSVEVFHWANWPSLNNTRDNIQWDSVAIAVHLYENKQQPIACEAQLLGQVLWWHKHSKLGQTDLVICPIAIAYSMGQIIKSVCVCVSVRLRALSRSHFLIDFYQNWHRRKNPEKWERVRWGSISHHPFPYFAPEPMQILSRSISALNVRESPKFTLHKGNRGRGTRWWRQILERKWKYGRFAHAQWKIRNITLIYGRIAEILAA